MERAKACVKRAMECVRATDYECNSDAVVVMELRVRREMKVDWMAGVMKSGHADNQHAGDRPDDYAPRDRSERAMQPRDGRSCSISSPLPPKRACTARRQRACNIIRVCCEKKKKEILTKTCTDRAF